MVMPPKFFLSFWVFPYGMFSLGYWLLAIGYWLIAGSRRRGGTTGGRQRRANSPINRV
jgi:hypothetical protein